MLSYPAAVPAFVLRNADSTSARLKPSIWLPSLSFFFCLRYFCHSSHTFLFCSFSNGAFATFSRWLATAFGFTVAWDCVAGCCAVPSRRIRFQLFRLECVKFIPLV